VHAAKHLWAQLCWLRDLAGLMEVTSIDFDRVANEATRLGAMRIHGVSLVLGQRLFGANVPNLLLNRWHEDPWIEAICKEITAQVSDSKVPDTESIHYFRQMIRLRERASDRIRFLGRLTFTPSVGEWSVLKLPAPLFPLHRLFRIFRPVPRVFGARRNCRQNLQNVSDR
jgi:hypothetical protein